MQPTCLQPSDLATPAGHYSPVVVGAGLVWVAGQLPIDRHGRALSEQPFEAQVQQVLANVQAALEAAGSAPEYLVQVRVYLADIAQWSRFNGLYAAWLGPHKPARATVPVPALPVGLLLQMEAVALLAPERDRP